MHPQPHLTRLSPRLARVLSVSQKVQSQTARKPAHVLGRAAFRTGAAWVQFGALPGVPGAACGEWQSRGVWARPRHPAALAPRPRVSDRSPHTGRPVVARLVALSSRYPKYGARTPASPASFLGGFGCSLRICRRLAENHAFRGCFERIGWMQIAAATGLFRRADVRSPRSRI